MELFDLKGQYEDHQEEIDGAIRNVLRAGHFIMGEAVFEMERALANFIGADHCIGVSSGTDALLLALMALGIGPGDEVITVPYTWISPVECIKRLGARPVLVDIDPETYLMDMKALEKAVTEKTKAIIPVSVYGQMPDFDRISEIADGIPVIEDGAQSFGSMQKGIYSCHRSLIGCTSFFPTKPLGCYGDGGALFTDDEELAEKIRALRVHGASVRYHHPYVGMNGRLDTLQAAVILAKLPFFKEELKKRKEIAEYYDRFLREDFMTPKVVPGNTHAYALYTLQSDQRDLLSTALKKESIGHGIYYPVCIHEQPAYADLRSSKRSLQRAEYVAKRVISIPMHPRLTRGDQDQVIAVLKSAILQEVR